jgi:hypothetical protein
MSCYFRVVGKKLEIDELLKKVNLEPDRVWHKGEPRFKSKPKGKKKPHSGASFVASDAEMTEFDLQVNEAIQFLETYKEDIEKLVAYPGVEEARLDFGINLREMFINSDYLPPKILALAGNLNIAIELSHYPPAKEDAPEEDES